MDKYKDLENKFIDWCFSELSSDENDLTFAGGVTGPNLSKKGAKILRFFIIEIERRNENPELLKE